MQGRKALDITWDEGPHASESSESLRKQFIENASKPGKVYRNDGDADSALAAPLARKKLISSTKFLSPRTLAWSR